VKRGYGSPNPQALRAAALLAQGNTAQARGAIERAIEMKRDRAIWAENLDALSSAIRQDNTAYRWTPGSCPDPDGYELLITYR